MGRIVQLPGERSVMAVVLRGGRWPHWAMAR